MQCWPLLLLLLLLLLITLFALLGASCTNARRLKDLCSDTWQCG